jgi:hypothetical protein
VGEEVDRTMTVKQRKPSINVKSNSKLSARAAVESLKTQ